MIFNVKGLSFQYPGRPVLDDVSFSLREGDCLAILGVNGAGKSTLLKCINKILKPHKGSVHLRENDIHDLVPRDLAKRMAYVAQKQEGARMTVFDSVLLGRKPYIEWDASERDLEIVQRAIESLDLQPYALRYMNELSGGEMQKVVLARALTQEPEVLLLDEPTSSLDLKNQLEVVHTVRSIAKKRQMTAIVTMHDLNLALRFADRFIMLRDGEIYAAGGREVITPQNVEAVYSVQVSVHVIDDMPVVIPV